MQNLTADSPASDAGQRRARGRVSAAKCHNSADFPLPRTYFADLQLQPLRHCSGVDHEHAVARVVAAVRAAGLPCLLVDDGSGEACARELRAPGGHRAAHERAAAAGQTPAKARRCSPASRRPGSAATATACRSMPTASMRSRICPPSSRQRARDPQALICGRPLFDRSMPAGPPLWPLSHACPGVAEYPVLCDTRTRCAVFGFIRSPRSSSLMAQEYIGRRMDFDVEIIVRLYWRGVPHALAAHRGDLSAGRGLPLSACSATTRAWSRCSCGSSAACCCGCRGCWRGAPRERTPSPAAPPGSEPTPRAQASWAATRERGARFDDVADVPHREAALAAPGDAVRLPVARRTFLSSAGAPGRPRATIWRGSLPRPRSAASNPGR